MFYPKAECCPFNSDNAAFDNNALSSETNKCKNNIENDNIVSTKCEMMRKIQEVDFAIIDLNLFLDTHPDCAEALELFTKLTATSKSLKNDYQAKYGPLYVTKSSNNVPFDWVEKCSKWPWER